MDDKCSSKFLFWQNTKKKFHFFSKESAEDDCVVAIVGNKTDLCDDDDKRPVKYKDGVKLADVKIRFFYFIQKKKRFYFS
jgi:hypothetical protein